MRRPLASLLAASFAVVAGAPSSGQCQLQELVPIQLAVNDHLGYGVGIDGGVAISGAMEASDLGPDTGSAYVFRLNSGTWATEQRLLASDASPVSRFGWSADIHGNVCAVGSPHHALTVPFQGAGYVFRWNGASWVEEALLTISGTPAASQFGFDVRMGDEDTILISATRAGSARSGAAYLYRWDGAAWVEDHVFTPSDGVFGDGFGTAVAIAEPLVVVGAISAGGSGKVYVYRDDGTNWVEEAILTGADTAAGDELGRGVTIDGDTIVAGAPLADAAATDDGAAYVWRYDGASWNQEAKLVPSYQVDDNWFGRSCRVRGDVLAVGAVRDMEAGFEAGATYTFLRTGTTWAEDAKLVRRGATLDEWSGGSLDLDGDYLMSGGYHVDSVSGVANSGVVTVFSNPDPSHATCYGETAGNSARLLAYGQTPIGGALNLIYENPAGAPTNATSIIALGPGSLSISIGTALIDPSLMLGFRPPNVSFATITDRPTQSIGLPLSPGLVGVSVYLQGAMFPVKFTFPSLTELTNGVEFTFCP